MQQVQQILKVKIFLFSFSNLLQMYIYFLGLTEGVKHLGADNDSEDMFSDDSDEVDEDETVREAIQVLNRDSE